MTETMSPTHINPLAAPKRQCLGIAVHETDARVIDPDTLEELGDAAVGEIIVHGPQVLRGYWNRPDAEASSFIERSGKRFLRTGDLGYRDSEGYFFAVERLKRMINVSGFKVWPAEVEATTAAFDRRGGLPTSRMSSSCRSIRSPNVRTFRTARGLDDPLRSMLRSISSAHSSPSLRRRNVSAT